MDNRPIGIFDSGLGGLTCVKEVMRIMPHEDIIYFGDTGRVPYGTRGVETVVKYAGQDIRFLMNFDIKFIIIACGTVSSAALPRINHEYQIEISGVVLPAARKAAETTRNGRIAVLGTNGTVRSGKYCEELLKYNPSFAVMQKACPLFVPLVENGHTGDKVAQLIAEEYLEEVKAFAPDTVILGCTHYPLMAETIQDYLGSGVTLINSGACSAAFAKEYLAGADMLSGRERHGEARYFVSDSAEDFTRLAGAFLQQELHGQVEEIEIENY